MASDPKGAFTTHANYFRALATEAGLGLLTSEEAALKGLALRIKGSASMQDRRAQSPDIAQVRRSLECAWGTELLLALSSHFIEDDEVIRLANNWAVVQAYYVGYHAVQALAAAKGFLRPATHPKTQRLYVDFWLKRPLDLSPWTLGASADGWANPPSGRNIDPGIHESPREW